MGSWVRIAARRDQFSRVGGTFGKGYNTVRAVRFLVNHDTAGGGTMTSVRLSDTVELGGPLTGLKEYCYVYVYDNGTYVAKSEPSAILKNVALTSQGVKITVPADASRDSQINYIWLFRRGGELDQFYRVATAAVSGTGSVDIDDTTSDEDALVTNITLEEEADRPPAGIIGIEGPYYDRLFALTSTHLYPSRRYNPDSFATSHVIQVAGADETALWVKKAIGGLYVGTTKDIYWITGDGAELPDGTINFTKRPLNIDNAPRSEAVATEGNLLVYLAADGWRAISGGGSKLLTGETSELYRGKTRYSVSPVNLSTGRFRAAIAQNQLSAITPEGASTTSSTKIYRHRFDSGHWYRHVYGRNWRCIYREPDGTLIASDNAGFVWTLDTGTQDDGSNIALELWTPDDDLGHPFSRKDPYDFRTMINTGSQTATLSLYPDSGSTPTAIGTANTSSFTESLYSLEPVASFHRAQIRLTGSFSTFQWAGYHIGVNVLPMMIRGQVPPFPFDNTGVKAVIGISMKVCTLGSLRTFTPVVNGVDGTTFAITSYTDEPVDFTHQFTTIQEVTDIWFKVDGDIELYSWKPIVAYELPPRVKIWENKPMVPSAVRRRFGGITLQVNTHGGTATVTPVLDGVDQTGLTTTSSDLLGKTLTFSSVVGRDLWCRVSCATAMTIHSVEPIVLETFPQALKGAIAYTNSQHPGEKVLTGIKVRACTMGSTVTVTPLLDGTPGTTFDITSAANEPDTFVHQFTAPTTVTDIAISFSANVELYEWEPLILYSLPPRVKAWENKPMVRSPFRRRFAGLTIQINTHGANVTVTPVLDGVDQSTTLIASSDLLARVITFSSVVGRDLWCRLTGSTPFTVVAVEPKITEEYPQVFKGLVPQTNLGNPGEKVFTGIKLKVCTLGVARTFTPYLDRVAGTTFQITSPADEPVTYIHQFTSAQTATDISFSVDGDIELFEWEPIVLYSLPPRVKVWENKPLVRSAVRRRFSGLMLQINTYGANATVTPVLDGSDGTPVTVNSSDLLAKPVMFSSDVGRDLWCRITSSTPFTIVAAEPIVIETLPQMMRGVTPRIDGGYPGIKSVSAVQLKVCTLGQTATVTPIVDGTNQTSFTVASGADDPVDLTHAFAGVVRGSEFSLSFDIDVELYSWIPLVTSKRPLGIKTWDSGPMDMGGREMVWPREIWIKAEASADLSIELQFDGKSYGTVTAALDDSGNTSKFRVTVPRNYKGKVPRLIITSTASFFPYWVEFVVRGTGEGTEKDPIRVAANLGGDTPA